MYMYLYKYDYVKPKIIQTPDMFLFFLLMGAGLYSYFM